MTSVVFETVSDNIIEGVESFNANIIVSPQMMAMGVFPGVPDTAVVLIDDSESKFISYRVRIFTLYSRYHVSQCGMHWKSRPLKNYIILLSSAAIIIFSLELRTCTYFRCNSYIRTYK